MSFSTAEVSMLKSLVSFVDENKFVDLKLSYRDGVLLNAKVTFDFAKKVKSSVKRVSDFDESGYPVMIFLDEEDQLCFQFNKNCLSEQMVKTSHSSLEKMLKEMQKNELFTTIKEKVDLSVLRSAIEVPQEEETEEKASIQDTMFDAEEEVMKMLESALGPMTSLLDKKFKQKMTHHALMQIIKAIVSVTLKTVDANTVENEKKVFAAIEESGISPKKEKRAGKLSGYTLFTKQMHQDKKEEFKSRGLKGADVTKEIGAMWKKLSEEQKQEYNEKAKKENEENPSASRKGSAKGSRKGSRKGSSKTDKESHKCCFVISKGERKGEMCGTTVRSDEPTFEGQYLCSKHATAEKKKSESSKNKKEKGSKKGEKKEKKEKKQKKDEDEEEEEKSSKVVKKQKKVKESEKSKKSEKKPAKKQEPEEEEEPEDIEDIDDIPELEEDGAEYDTLNSMCVEWEEDRENCMINAKMSKSSLEKLTGKKLSSKEYEVKMSATKSSLIIKYEEDDEEEMKSIKMEKMTEDLKKVHRFLASMEESE
jgi:hypothetical protein